MSHETGLVVSVCLNCERLAAMSYFVILSSMDLGSSRNVGKVTLLKSAPGRSWEMMWDSTVGVSEAPGVLRSLYVGIIRDQVMWTDRCLAQAPRLFFQVSCETVRIIVSVLYLSHPHRPLPTLARRLSPQLASPCQSL